MLPDKGLNVWPTGAAAQTAQAPDRRLLTPPEQAAEQEAEGGTPALNTPDTQPQDRPSATSFEGGGGRHTAASPGTPTPLQQQGAHPKAVGGPPGKEPMTLPQKTATDKATKPPTPRSGKSRKRRRSEAGSDDASDSGDSRISNHNRRHNDVSPIPLTLTRPSSQPASDEPPLADISEGPTLEALISFPIARAKQFCKDRGVDMDAIVSRRAVYATAIMLRTGACKLVGTDSQLKAALQAAMPPSGWASKQAVQRYGAARFPFWNDCGNAVENLYRIVQGLLAREGVISVPDMNGELVRVGVPTFTITRPFCRLFSGPLRAKDKHSSTAFHFRFVDWNLAEYSLYSGQPLFQVLDQRLRAVLTRWTLNQRKTGDFLYRLGVGIVYEETGLKRKKLEPKLPPWDLKVNARGAVVPVDFTVGLWILVRLLATFAPHVYQLTHLQQAIGHVHVEGRRRQQQKGGAEDYPSPAGKGGQEPSAVAGPSAPSGSPVLPDVDADREGKHEGTAEPDQVHGRSSRRRRPIARHVVISDSEDEH